MGGRDKAILDKCFKMTKKGKKEADREIALRVAPDLKGSPKEGIRMAVGTTRAELMAQCKARGIKNYRVINKVEMGDILAHIGDQVYIDKVVAGAVARWKQGWGQKGGQPAGSTKGTSHPKEQE